MPVCPLPHRRTLVSTLEDTLIPDSISAGQHDAIYNIFSLVIASQLFAALFMIACLPRILPRYRQAMIVAATVCGIAAYHYFRIFNSFNSSFVTDSVGGRGDYTQSVGEGFNEGYRYVDWLLTVPLLLVELVAVLALARKLQTSLLLRLVPAAALMIILGYPGELSGDNSIRNIFGTLSTIPFLYILYILFVEMTKSLGNQPPQVRSTISRLRILLVATWGVYPIAYLLPVLGFDGSAAWTGKQIGYSIADILAKALYGLIIYRVARIKSFADDPSFAETELSAHEARELSGHTDKAPASASRN
ncbi:bacteriorhodopsin-like [Actinomycetes bacterium M1A6_2h]